MSLISNFTINIYSMLVLIILYVQYSKHLDREYFHNKLFIQIIRITFLMLIFDILGRFDGNPSTINSLFNQVGNYMLFLLSPTIPILWLSYVHFQIYQDESRTKKLMKPLFILIMINFVFLNLSQLYGWFYYINSQNIYYRGPFYFLPASLPFIFIFGTSIFILINKNLIAKKHYLPLLLFALPPLIGTILQLVFYGISFVLNGMVLSILIVQINIQNKNIFTDYLTGLNNRKRLDMYMKEKMESASIGRTFSAVMVDIDEFKVINDEFGHDAGDKALKIFANILTTSLRSNDFIARFGGDEFYIIMDISDEVGLLDVVNRIKTSLKRYNEISGEAYKLNCSMGYAIYDCKSNMSVGDFQKYIDSLMYEDKKTRKNIKVPLLILNKE